MQSHKRRTNGTTAAAIWIARRLFAACCCLALLALPQVAYPFGALTTVTNVSMNGSNVTVDSFYPANTNHSNWNTNSIYGTFAPHTLPQPTQSVPFGAITCLTNISLGIAAMVDSFDSADPSHSDWNTNLGCGTYDFTKHKANGNVATDGQLINAQNAKIYGHVDTGPGGVTTVSSSGSAGSLAWVDGFNSGIQPGYSSDDMNVTFPNVTLPLGPWTLFSGSTITNSGIYQINSLGSLTISAPTPTPVNVTLYLPNGFTYSGSQAFNVGTNAHVTIYTGGNINTTGNGSLNNLTQNARNLAIYALPSVTSISLQGNAAFIGTIYAPEALVTFGGAPNNPYDILGAVVSLGASFNGHANIHFDENLARYNSFPFWFTTQPKSQAVQVGSNVTFTVSTDGGLATNRWWLFNRTNLIANSVVGDTNNPPLSLTNVQLTDSGTYSVVVTNLFGAITSAPAILFVYTNTAQLAAQLAAPANPTNDQFQFNIAGVTGFNYAVQVSSNLVNWVSLQTNIVPFGFTDTNVNQAPQRFYRSVIVP